MKQKNWREEMQKIYQEIQNLNPTYEEISEYASRAEHGEITYTKKDNNPLIIRLHDTYGIKFQGKLHIDIISGEFHLMLDKNHAPRFLDFINVKRG